MHLWITTTYLAQYSSNEKVMFLEVWFQYMDVWTGIQSVFLSEAEESPVWVKSSLEQLGQKFSKYSTSIDSSFIQANSIC